MCWSGEASAALAVGGIGMTIYLIKSGEDKALWLTLFYFTLMELLQAVTYVYIDECHRTINQILTLIGYVHIAFQPFFINMCAMYFIPKTIKTKITPYIYVICTGIVIAFLFKLYPFVNSELCYVNKEAMCGPFLCSYSGNWHIAWQLPLNDLSYQAFIGSQLTGLHTKVYAFGAFALPLLYGSWRFALCTFILGPCILVFLTDDINEFPAIWCLFSIGICCTIIKTPIRKYLHVKNWFFYPKTKRGQAAAKTHKEKVKHS